MRSIWPFDFIMIATTNNHKLKQFTDLFSPLGLRVLGLHDLEEKPEIVEDQPTFEGNATKKAEVVAHKIGGPVISDDSGLVVPILDGEPGVYSARYAGENATDEENNQKLLEKMKGVPEQARGAYYICVMAIAMPSKPTICFYGECYGTILSSPRGTNGFGYDPLFYLPTEGLTMAELPTEKKYEISHRGKATRQLLAWLKDHYFFE